MKRPPIPESVKRAVIYLNMRRNKGVLLCAEQNVPLYAEDVLHGRIHFDHNPPLALRLRTEGGAFSPPANDPAFIEVVSIAGHAVRTFKKRGLQRGDLTAIAHSRKVRRSNGLEPAKPKQSRSLRHPTLKRKPDGTVVKR